MLPRNKRNFLFIASVSTVVFLFGIFCLNDNDASGFRNLKLHKYFYDSESIANLFYFPSETLKERVRTTCYSLPNANDIAYNNIYWQVFEMPNTKLYLFSAHYDDRPIHDTPFIHILGEVTRKLNISELRCLFWYNQKKNALASPVESVIYLSSDLKRKVSFRRIASESVIISCRMPNVSHQRVPYAVGLIRKNTCGTINNNALKVHRKKDSRQKHFAVCMKGLQFPDDLSIKLVEWIELNKLFGAEFFSFYIYSAHENVEKVLKYYSDAGVAESLRITLPGTLPNINEVRQKFYEGVGDAWPHEYIPINDCYMRNMKNTDYIVVADLDELIVPLNSDSWLEMLQRLSLYNVSTLSFADLYFWDEVNKCDSSIPCYLHFMQRTLRAKKHFEDKTISHHYKSIHDTSKVVTVTHHFERVCFEKCKRYYVPIEEAQLQHYRKTCIFDITNKMCYQNFKKGSFVQNSLWKYRHKAVPAIQQVLEELNLLVSDNHTNYAT
ncbi:hypothetical protein QYM36_016581 [Artemia franciscana]|uniref:Glycosyltransferase family 92 protein n=2 Tax=Artemia franciscana TaxID=6661 RepID=A0AA88HCL7_ARTSF|nr:hypothetical protein QYM36_016581 [Artemia franciscana]